MLRCAARINSGSASAIAFSAASRSPRLIASSTLRTAPRIWVRRDLLIAVRRAILRVAFLAEVVLAIVSNSFGGDRQLLIADRRVACLNGGDRRCRCFGAFLRVPVARANMLKAQRRQATPKEQRRRDCARRHRRP